MVFSRLLNLMNQPEAKFPIWPRWLVESATKVVAAPKMNIYPGMYIAPDPI